MRPTAAFRLLDPLVRSPLGERLVLGAFRLWTSAVARQPPEVALRRLLEVTDRLLARIDVLAIDLDGGVHAKHRLTGYHDFFVAHIAEGERVLDVGCGKGELAADLARRARARVVGVDFSEQALGFARTHAAGLEVELVHADVLDWEPPGRFDVVALSNVLEHIAPRVELLSRLLEKATPARMLIRVPSVERDWLVPLRGELGLWRYSDPTHETEYTPETLREELNAAGLDLVELEQRWGELWAVARPVQGGTGLS